MRRLPEILLLLSLSACANQSVVGGVARDVPVPLDASMDASLDASGVIDATDLPLPRDAAGELTDVALDAPAESAVDAPSGCERDGECTDPSTPVCDPSTRRCVGCVATRDTCPRGSYCDAAAQRCAPGCDADDDCSVSGVDAGAPTATRCELGARRCVQCVNDDHCAIGNLCVGNVCVAGCGPTRGCADDARCCGSACVDTRSSIAHCGACGLACPTPPGTAPRCEAGRCSATCVAGRGDCDGDRANGCETDPSRDPAHCGACGRSCLAAQVATAACVASTCSITACAPGFADCDGSVGSGCETAVSENNAACGRCGNACAPGARCVAGTCVEDCRRTGAVPCGDGAVCDFGNGRCVAPGTRCALSGAFAACGAQSCGPGASCNPRSQRCEPALSCRALTCEDSGGRCWGSDCPCERPAASCATLAPASVPAGFLSGAFGFDIDDACNLYTATMLSGPDFVRRLSPSGALNNWTSVANLNMGEVAVQRRANVGGSGAAANVAFTYICCAACGCASNPPQGVGHVQVDGALPVVVPAVVTSGAGPFGVNYLDTGPYGLSVSSLGEFFVGNVRANGDWYRYDTDTRAITVVATLPQRVTASTAFDLDTMLVAVEGGALFLVDRAPGTPPQRLGSFGTDVQSIRRDPFTGRLYAALRDRRLVSCAPDLSDLRVEAMPGRGARIAISPDGWLYLLLAEGGPISRLQLPVSR